jgi:hypothetical protein
VLGIARALPGPARDLDMIYLPGLDIAQHTLLAASDVGAASTSVMTERVDAIKRYYTFLERLLEPIARPTERQVVMIVASPGRIETATPGMVGVTYADGDIYGRPTVRPVTDVAPTVLHLLGIPLSRELSGEPIRTLMMDETRRQETRYVSTYGRPNTGTNPRQGKPLDQEAIDRLRSLGYVR